MKFQLSHLLRCNRALKKIGGLNMVVTELKKREVSNMVGKVKWFDDKKGYGFIEYNDYEDIFVHYSSIKQTGHKTLTEGQLVEFNLLETTKGLQALEVIVIKDIVATSTN